MRRAAAGLAVPARDLLAFLPDGDAHCHTVFSDGTASPDTMLYAAAHAGLRRLAITDHADSPWIIGDNWRTHASAIRAAAAEAETEAIFGAEASLADLDGGLALDEALAAEVEILIGSVHRFPRVRGRIRDMDPDQAMLLERDCALSLASQKRIDVLGHIGGVCISLFGRYPLEFAEEAIIRAAANGIAVEISGRYHSLWLANFIELCVRHDALVVLSSDAHRPEDVGLAHRLIKEMTIHD